MIDKIKRFLRPNNHKRLQVTTDQEVIFKLSLPDIEVGELKYNDGLWSFSYSDTFAKSSSFEPIPDFPDKSKDYSDETLWPFFLSRIPSMSRSRIKDTVEEENLDDLLKMLDRFGKRTITNPYILETS